MYPAARERYPFTILFTFVAKSFDESREFDFCCSPADTCACSTCGSVRKNRQENYKNQEFLYAVLKADSFLTD